MRHGFRLTVLTSAVALALMASVTSGAAVGAQAAVAPRASLPAAGASRASLPAAVAPVAPHTMYISVANRYLTMSRRITAGTYYVQVRTSDPRSVVQVVRAPTGHTPRQFLDAATRWNNNGGADPRAAYAAFVHSGIFVGGAAVTRGAIASFATGFVAGTYWLYEDSYDVPTHLARIVVLTVVGASPVQTPVPVVGLARIGSGAPSLPSTLPTSGWLKAIGYAPLNSLLVRKLVPGVTKADLDTFGVCFGDATNIQTKNCFDVSADLFLGGKISAGASVYWYYHLAPGDYITGNIAPNEYFDRPLLVGHYARFTVS